MEGKRGKEEEEMRGGEGRGEEGKGGTLEPHNVGNRLTSLY